MFLHTLVPRNLYFWLIYPWLMICLRWLEMSLSICVVGNVAPDIYRKGVRYIYHAYKCEWLLKLDALGNVSFAYCKCFPFYRYICYICEQIVKIIIIWRVLRALMWQFWSLNVLNFIILIDYSNFDSIYIKPLLLKSH